jgi:hypothetical protein
MDEEQSMRLLRTPQRTLVEITLNEGAGFDFETHQFRILAHRRDMIESGTKIVGYFLSADESERMVQFSPQGSPMHYGEPNALRSFDVHLNAINSYNYLSREE